MDQRLQTFAARLDALPLVLACVDNCRHGVDPRMLLRVRIAVEELFVNSVRHGSGTAQTVQVGLCLTREGEAAVLCYEDSAPPFDPFFGLEGLHDALGRPLEVRGEGGMGRLLVRQLADAAAYVRRDGHNCIELRFLPRSDG